MVYALGLGQLDLKSGLNQPFEAQIELLSATPDELQNLRVGLADIDAFRRARIDRPFILSKLRFKSRRVKRDRIQSVFPVGILYESPS